MFPVNGNNLSRTLFYSKFRYPGVNKVSAACHVSTYCFIADLTTRSADIKIPGGINWCGRQGIIISR
jgi:hypothetical protein